MRANKRPTLTLIALLSWCSGWSASLPPRCAADEPKKTQHWALLIGVNDYANVQHLRYCVADQEALAKQLTASGFPSDQVYLMDDQAKEQKFRPSKLNIERQLEVVLAMPSSGDTVVLGFSGHGVQIAGKSYICPADCDLERPKESMIPLDKVFEELASCKASLKLLIVDACRNNVEIGGKRTINNERSVRAFGESLERPPEGISLLTSCSPGQFAREHEQLGHGVFIHFVLEGLAGKAADDDGIVRLGRLLDYTSLNTLKYVHDQFNATQRPYYKLEASGPVELCRIARLVSPFGPALARAAQQAQATQLRVPQETTNSIGMKLTLIPAGEFMMGSPENEPERLVNEKLHRVCITKPFYFGTYEVTQAEYENIMGSNPSWFSRSGAGTDVDESLDTNRFPVENVTWINAQEFCKRLSAKEGKVYRLPTEAEWEYVCRAGTTTAFNVGGALSRAEANCDGKRPHDPQTDGTYLNRTTTIGSYQPNSFGIYDMHGNAGEWCRDWYDPEYYATSPTDDPKGPNYGSSRVVRGGSWSDDHAFCRSACRFGATPSARNSYYIGFRVVCETQ